MYRQLYTQNSWNKWCGEGQRKKFLNRIVKKSWSAALLKQKNLMGVTDVREKIDLAKFTHLKKYRVNSPKEKKKSFKIEGTIS